MRRTKSGNRILAMLLATVLALTPTQTAWAAEDVSDGLEPIAEETGTQPEESAELEESADEKVADEDQEPSSEETEEPSDDTEVTDTEEPGETDSETPSEIQEPAEEETPSEEPEEAEPTEEVEPEETEPVEEPAEEEDNNDLLFPGLENRSLMSNKMKADKEDLRMHISDLDGLKEGEDYEEGRITVSADNVEVAELYARAYNGELAGYTEGVALIELDEDVTVKDAVDASADADVLLPAAWPNYYRYAYGDPMTDDVTSEMYQYYHDVIGSNEAHQYGYTGKGVKVAVLDSGIKTGHEDVNAVAFSNGSASDDYGAEDGNGHGTHVAGIIGATKDNGLGGKGVAPDATMISVKVLGDDGSGTIWGEIAGINKAVAEGADIINMSLGSVGTYHPSEKEACDNARNKGTIVIAAAGNESTNSRSYPAGYDSVVSVAALETDNTKTYFSNYGSWVDYCAPGVNIWSTYYTSNNAYMSMDGTSQATPIFAGTAAVLLASSEDVQKETGEAKVEALLKLMDKGVVKANGTGIGKGYVNLVKALGLLTVDTTPSAPEFNVENKTKFDSSTATITISHVQGSEVYYTLDGQNVSYKDGMASEGAEKYSEDGIVLSGSGKITVKAIAVNPSTGQSSKQVSAVYELAPKAEDTTIHIISPVTVWVDGYGAGSKLLPNKTVQLSVLAVPAKKVTAKWSIEKIAGDADAVTITNKGKVKALANASADTIYKVTATVDGVKEAAVHYIQVVAKADNMVTKIKATTKKVVIGLGGERELQYSNFTVTTQTGTLSADNLHWASKNVNIVEVVERSDGICIKGHSAGKTSVIGTAPDGSGKTVSIAVTVGKPVKSISITSPTKVMLNKPIALKAKVTPAKAANKKIIWSVTDLSGNETSGAEINAKGKLTITAPDNYRVTAIAEDGAGAEKNITISTISSAMSGKITVPKTASIFRVTNAYNAPVSTILTVTADNGNWDVTVDKPGIATAEKLDDTQFEVTATGKTTGKVKVTVAATDGSNKKAVCTVTVNNPVKKMHIAPQTGRLNWISVDRSLKFTATLEGDGKLSTASKKLEWSIDKSDEEFVSVNTTNGTVTAKKEKIVSDATGSYYAPVTIMAKTEDGSEAVATYQIYTMPKITKLALEDSEGDLGWAGDWSDVSIPIVINGQVIPSQDIPSIPFEVQVSGNDASAQVQWITLEALKIKIPVLRIMANINNVASQLEKSEDYTKWMTITVKDMSGSGLKTSIKMCYGIGKDGKPGIYTPL